MDLIPKHLTLESVTAQIRRKYPDASILLEDIQAHQPEFVIMERYLKLKRIGLRAITLPRNENGIVTSPVGLSTYHWACFRGTIEELEVYVVSFKPNPMVIKQRTQHFLNPDVSRYEQTKEAWQNFQDCVQEGFKVPRKYFEPTPDPDCNPEEIAIHEQLLAAFLPRIEETPRILDGIKVECQKYITAKYDKLMKEYHETYNEYHLARADFYRKLKAEDMSKEHLVLTCMVHREFIASAFLEKVLRTDYTEKIGSI